MRSGWSDKFHGEVAGGVEVALNPQVVWLESMDVGVTPLVDNVDGAFPEVMSSKVAGRVLLSDGGDNDMIDAVEVPPWLWQEEVSRL